MGLARDGVGVLPAGLVHWRPERCLAQLRYPGCAADLGLAEMSVAEAADYGARTLVIGTAPPGGQLPEPWIDTLEDALSRVKDAGGRVISDIITIPVGRFAYCLDTEGNSIGLFSY